MKKNLLLICMLLACVMQVNAQEPKYVSTETANRNVLIEEYTGRNCGWCPVGQKIVNNIVEKNEGRVFTVNIHPQGNVLSPTSSPNLNTVKGGELYNVFGTGGLPGAVINRTTEKTEGLSSTNDVWEPMTNEQLAQVAECNIAGHVSINPDTRLARITVEVYYTADSKVDENYLTVIMLQDNIIGEQSGAEGNPSQMVGDKYRHMHVYRNTITDKWGNAISPTTAGTLITKTFKYTIPESIGDPNGVDVDLNNLHFLAFVSEKHESGGKTMPILNVCELSDKENEDEDSLEDVNAASFNVYPNPVKDEIRISSEEMIENIAIYNINGQQLIADCQNPTANSCAVNVSNLNPGVYFIKVNGKAQKFVKQ